MNNLALVIVPRFFPGLTSFPPATKRNNVSKFQYYLETVDTESLRGIPIYKRDLKYLRTFADISFSAKVRKFSAKFVTFDEAREGSFSIPFTQ